MGVHIISVRGLLALMAHALGGNVIGKRSDYELRPRDKYFTPKAAVEPLKGFLAKGVSFCEPCAGDGRLVTHLEEIFDAVCFLGTDIEPDAEWILEADANDLTEEALQYCELIITNPPFTWKILQPLLDKWISLRPTLLLLPADFMHNKRVAPYMKHCVWVKSVGRVRWIEESKMTGVDNYAWYMFDKDVSDNTQFYGRT